MSRAVDIIRTVYYIHSPWRAKKNSCCFICVSYGPYTLLLNDGFFTLIQVWLTKHCQGRGVYTDTQTHTTGHTHTHTARHHIIHKPSSIHLYCLWCVTLSTFAKEAEISHYYKLMTGKTFLDPAPSLENAESNWQAYLSQTSDLLRQTDRQTDRQTERLLSWPCEPCVALMDSWCWPSPEWPDAASVDAVDCWCQSHAESLGQTTPTW